MERQHTCSTHAISILGITAGLGCGTGISIRDSTLGRAIEVCWEMCAGGCV